MTPCFPQAHVRSAPIEGRDDFGMHKNFVFASTSSGGICQLAVKLPPRSVATTGGIHATRRCFPPGTPSNPLASAQFRQRELHTLYSEHRCKMLGLVIVLPDKNQRNGQARSVVQERKSSLRRVQQCARQTVIIAGVTNRLITSRHGLAGYESRDASLLDRGRESPDKDRQSYGTEHR